LTAFLAVLALALFALIGLAVDGGRSVAAQIGAMGDAEQAARVGAGQVSIDGIRRGLVVIDPVAAIHAATDYLGAIGRSGTVSVSGATVTVTIDSSEPTMILGMVGVPQIRVVESASATDLHGVTRSD
jgi:hypothetical protein